MPVTNKFVLFGIFVVVPNISDSKESFEGRKLIGAALKTAIVTATTAI